jgi:uncharacterized protein
MLIEFSVGNYRSFQETVTFSMVAANLVAKHKHIDEQNVIPVAAGFSLLRSAAIYGANASGKSNLAKAMDFMQKFMVNSSRETQSTDEIPYEPFRLSTETENQPSFFELVFLMAGQRYRYGFEVDQHQIVSEWLFYVPKARETKLFERDREVIQASKAFEADGIAPRTRRNALFLSVAAQFNVKIAENILTWLTQKIRIISGLQDDSHAAYTMNCLLEHKNRDEILELIKRLDLGISDLEVKPQLSLPEEMPENLKRLIIRGKLSKASAITTLHHKFDAEGKAQATERFDLHQHESEGTQKVFALAGLLVDTLKEGKVLIIDELDARLHPLMTLEIVRLFNSTEANPHQAQLVFMTHDTNLLDNQLFRRDQIWFTEKDRYGATHLYSLAEYKVRNDAAFENDYIKGRYGAIPYIQNRDVVVQTHA